MSGVVTITSTARKAGFAKEEIKGAKVITINTDPRFEGIEP